MDWIYTVLTGLALLVLAAPLLMLAVTFFILVPLAHLAPRPRMIARSTFDCPFSRQRATVEFVTSPEATQPTDVHACSVFPDGVACAKGCRHLAVAGWAPSPTVPRYALIADGTAYR
jgi:hypothetical protein